MAALFEYKLRPAAAPSTDLKNTCHAPYPQVTSRLPENSPPGNEFALKSIVGSICALATPFRGGAVDFDAFAKLIDFQLDGGTQALVVAGSTGEAHSLDSAEYDQLLRQAVARVAGRATILAGTGTANTRKTIELTRRAQSLGADAALVVTPYYVRPTQEGLLRHYTEVADHGDLPVVLYNVPGRTGCDLKPETVAKLALHERIVGVKEAVGTPERVAALAALRSSKFAFLSGDDPTGMAAILAGAEGVISVAANAAPRPFRALCDAARAGGIAEGAERPRRGIGRHRNDALGAGQDRGHAGRVVTAEERELGASQRGKGCHTFGRADRLFDADDALMQRQFRDGFRFQIAPRAARHVVEHDRQVTMIGDLGIVAQQTFLSRTHVVRRHDERRIGTETLRATRQLDGFARIRRAGTGQDRRPTRHAGNGLAQQLVVFGGIERMGFAGRTGHHERLRATVELEVDQFGERIEIDRASTERGGESTDAADDTLQGELVAWRGILGEPRCYLRVRGVASILQVSRRCGSWPQLVFEERGHRRPLFDVRDPDDRKNIGRPCFDRRCATPHRERELPAHQRVRRARQVPAGRHRQTHRRQQLHACGIARGHARPGSGGDRARAGSVGCHREARIGAVAA